MKPGWTAATRARLQAGFLQAAHTVAVLETFEDKYYKLKQEINTQREERHTERKKLRKQMRKRESPSPSSSLVATISSLSLSPRTAAKSSSGSRSPSVKRKPPEPSPVIACVHSYGPIATECESTIVNYLIQSSRQFANIQLRIVDDQKSAEVQLIQLRCILLTEPSGRIEAQQRYLLSLLKQLPPAKVTYCLLLLPYKNEEFGPPQYLESFGNIYVNVVLYHLPPRSGLVMLPGTTLDFVETLLTYIVNR